MTNAHVNPNAYCNAPIGIFDSGIGGLSVYAHLHYNLNHQSLNERFIYYADTKHIPYGDKSANDIVAYSMHAVKFLVNKGAKILVVACNSASAAALDALRAHFTIPIVGLVPAIKPAVLQSCSKKIAVLATAATLSGNLMQTLVRTHKSAHIDACFMPDLVRWVEDGMPKNSVHQALLDKLFWWHAQNIDMLVLGCTHYPFFRHLIETHIAKHHLNITVIDSGAAIAERVRHLLSLHDLFAKKTTHRKLAHHTLQYCATKNTALSINPFCNTMHINSKSSYHTYNNLELYSSNLAALNQNSVHFLLSDMLQSMNMSMPNITFLQD